MQGTLQNFFCIFLLFSGLITPLPEYVGLFFVFSARSPPGTQQGSDHPLPGHSPAAPAGSSRRRRCAPAAGRWSGQGLPGRRRAHFRTAKSKSPVPGWTFAGRSGKVLCPAGLLHGEAEKCARAGFRRVGFRAAGVPRRAKKPGFFSFFSGGLRACIRKPGLLFPKKRG